MAGGEGGKGTRVKHPRRDNDLPPLVYSARRLDKSPFNRGTTYRIHTMSK